MNRSQHVMATLAAAGPGATFTPVQVQKIFFLLDERAANLLGGPHFSFQPYDYGPFDQEVYHELDRLQLPELVRVDTTGRYRMYALTDAGYAQGRQLCSGLAPEVQSYIRQTVEWVRQLRFDQLVAAIYREFPQMKAKSIFNQ
jgi:uncharacterized protein